MAVVIELIIAPRRPIWACLALACLGVCGCAGITFNWEGKWSGNRGYKAKAGESPVIAYTLGKVDLVIKNGRYELFEQGIPRSGVVSQDSGTLRLTEDSVMNRKTAMRPDGTLRMVDQNTVEFRGNGLDQAPVRLKRASQPGR